MFYTIHSNVFSSKMTVADSKSYIHFILSETEKEKHILVYLSRALFQNHQCHCGFMWKSWTPASENTIWKHKPRGDFSFWEHRITWEKWLNYRVVVLSLSVMSDSFLPHGLQPTRLLCPWNFPGKNTGVDCHFLLQGIFPTQGSNPSLLYWCSF